VANHGQHLIAMETLSRLLLRSESVASSRIEGLECSQRRLAEAAFAPEHASETARQVLANIAAMRSAIELGTAERDRVRTSAKAKTAILESIDSNRWVLTTKGHRLREMIRAGDDLGPA